METTLHRQLKAHFAGPEMQTERRLEGFRIDAIEPGSGVLLEVQASSLGALKQKVIQLVAGGHQVRVIKPIAIRTQIVRVEPKRGREISRRWSPVRGNIWHLFQDLVHLMPAFPRAGLELEVVLCDQVEQRVETKSWGRRKVRVKDRELLQINESYRLTTGSDLLQWFPETLPLQFTSAELAEVLGLPVWWAHKITYCLRRAEAVSVLGKQKRAWLYHWSGQLRKSA